MSSCNNIIRLKRGDTLRFELSLTDGEGSPISSMDEIRSQIRDGSYNLIDEFDITDMSGGKYLFETDDTSGYPITDLLFDIEITINGIVSSSDTKTIRVQKDVTYDEPV